MQTAVRLTVTLFPSVDTYIAEEMNLNQIAELLVLKGITK
jgi:hypothetical protein